MKLVDKPWGNEKHFIFNKQCTVKILSVNPKQSLSLQYHKKRNELWYFLTPGIIQIGMHKRHVKKGETIIVKKWRAHRIFAENKKVEVLEISFGKFKQKDEIRIDDKYGRE